MTRGRALPFLTLLASAAGMLWFSQGYRVVDTAGLLASGAMAGASLAALSGRRRAR